RRTSRRWSKSRPGPESKPMRLGVDLFGLARGSSSKSPLHATERHVFLAFVCIHEFPVFKTVPRLERKTANVIFKSGPRRGERLIHALTAPHCKARFHVHAEVSGNPAMITDHGR